ncbi:hypothetical protein IE81DRAFT_204527 [Ceraceosorus guamensis]|uniref:Senescence domain-containing protein n=1 Tax=Ceraceosorus guamensis TaxID=1522189 RepID=A0A316VZ36_9BASI|nr:hypothetical protein IE81DRAFT_204527 [Ceraceosorus guamensis]PWN40745.1 hypothetical protein IE81DRAFT_204527 [Ceraceosorus guamensis]
MPLRRSRSNALFWLTLIALIIAFEVPRCGVRAAPVVSSARRNSTMARHLDQRGSTTATQFAQQPTFAASELDARTRVAQQFERSTAILRARELSQGRRGTRSSSTSKNGPRWRAADARLDRSRKSGPSSWTRELRADMTSTHVHRRSEDDRLGRGVMLIDDELGRRKVFQPASPSPSLHRRNIFKKIGHAFKKAAETVGGGIKKAAEVVGGGVKSVAEKIGDGVKSAAQKVGGAVSDAAKVVGEKVVTAAEATANFAQRAGRGIATVASRVPDTAKAVANATVNGFKPSALVQEAKAGLTYGAPGAMITKFGGIAAAFGHLGGKKAGMMADAYAQVGKNLLAGDKAIKYVGKPASWKEVGI